MNYNTTLSSHITTVKCNKHPECHRYLKLLTHSSFMLPKDSHSMGLW